MRSTRRCCINSRRASELSRVWTPRQRALTNAMLRSYMPQISRTVCLIINPDLRKRLTEVSKLHMTAAIPSIGRRRLLERGSDLALLSPPSSSTVAGYNSLSHPGFYLDASLCNAIISRLNAQNSTLGIANAHSREGHHWHDCTCVVSSATNEKPSSETYLSAVMSGGLLREDRVLNRISDFIWRLDTPSADCDHSTVPASGDWL